MAAEEAKASVRKVRIEMWNDDRKAVDADNLAVDFAVTRTCAAVYDKATISIRNLSEENFKAFTIPWRFIREEGHLRIRLFAGYSTETLIFEGFITEAVPTGVPPDITLSCTCAANFGISNRVVELKGLKRKGDTLEKLLRELSRALKWNDPVWKANEEYKNLCKGNFYARGTMVDILRDLEKSYKEIETYFEFAGRICVCNRDKPPAVESGTLRAGGSEDGALPLIGIPKIEPYGIRFMTLLNTSAVLNQKVLIKSVMIPDINDTSYYIKTITHRGSSRGNSFYTEYVCSAVAGGE